MKLRHITRYLPAIPFLLLSLATFGYTSRAATAREGRKPPLQSIVADIDKLSEKPSTEEDHEPVATIHSRRPLSPLNPSRYRLHPPQRPSAVAVPRPPSSVNQLNSQHGLDRLDNGNQFINFLLAATILRQLVNTLADQMSSEQPGVGVASSIRSSTRGSSKGQVLEGSEVAQDTSENSRGAKVEEGSTDDKGCKRESRESPVWVRFEPWIGSWIDINEENLFVATDNFNFGEFTIKRGEIGSVVNFKREEGLVIDTRITKSVTLEFPEEKVFSKLDFGEPPLEDRDATQPVPVWMSPFLLLPEKNPGKTIVHFKGNELTPPKELRRDGSPPLELKKDLNSFI